MAGAVGEAAVARVAKAVALRAQPKQRVPERVHVVPTTSRLNGHPA